MLPSPTLASFLLETVPPPPNTATLCASLRRGLSPQHRIPFLATYLHHEVSAATQLSPNAAVVTHNQAFRCTSRVVGSMVLAHNCIHRGGDVYPGIRGDTQQVYVNP